jgi:hypothetical protein
LDIVSSWTRRIPFLTISQWLLEAARSPFQTESRARALSGCNWRNMTMELLLIIVVLMLLFGGGGYGYSRWRG